MKEMRDPAIKLFGKEIALVETGGAQVISGGDERVIKTVVEKQGKERDEIETNKDSQLDKFLPMEEEETLPNPQDESNPSPILEENGNENENTHDSENEANNLDQKTLKKPDKILPCPRCNSMDTKFCYYNNYNVNQPRHFCKGCQRYWTAGGTMRNVPVGAGRRKNKNSASHCRHITISEPTNGMVFSFGPEPPKTSPIFRNGILKMEKENGSDCSSGSSIISTSNSIERNGYNNQVPHLQAGYPWPYPGIPNPGFCPPGYPIPVYPIPWIPNPWPVPWIPNPCRTNPKPANPSPSSPLGKHSRNGEMINPINSENKESEKNTILIPKTLRIDDPDEALKSSIWATLGINNDSVNRKSLFKAFKQKGDDKKHNYEPETPTSMQANPAAMSRSLNFRETA